MTTGTKTGGRQKGTPNKRTEEIQAKLEELGCDPIEGMARIAADEKNSPELRGRMYAELAQYVAPKQRAVEHSGDAGGSFLDLLISLGQMDREERSNEQAKNDGHSLNPLNSTGEDQDDIPER